MQSNNEQRFRECEIGLDALSWDEKTIKGAALLIGGPKWALQCWTAFAKCSQENISSLLTCIFLNERKKERSCSPKKKKGIYGISFLFSISKRKENLQEYKLETEKETTRSYLHNQWWEQVNPEEYMRIMPSKNGIYTLQTNKPINLITTIPICVEHYMLKNLY